MTGIGGEPLPLSFFRRPAPEVARDLLGAVVVSRLGRARTTGRIVETEAYLGVEDPASHAWNGRRTPSNESLYGSPGTWYVYRSYGLHWCANLVSGPSGRGAAVLIRGLEPVEGVETMRRRRGGVADRLLCDGPGKLCQALGITSELDGRPMADSSVLVFPGERPARFELTPRIGITRAVEWPLRFLAAPLA